MKGLADKGEREEKRRNEGQKGLGDMNPLTHITITPVGRPGGSQEGLVWSMLDAEGAECTAIRVLGG